MNAIHDRIAELAAAGFAQRGMPAMAVCVVREQSVVYSAGFGYADRWKRRSCTADTRFAIGSVTKQFTAVATLLLVHEGKLRLDERVASFAPMLPNAERITVRQLLNQTSGLHNYPNTLEHRWPLRGAVQTPAILDILATDKPDFEPGTRFAYSNANYAVLSAIIEQTSGMSYGAFLRERIFEPLGMSRSGYGHALQSCSDVAQITGWRAWFPITLDLFSGAGGVVSTASDLAKWNRALLAGSLLGEPLMRELWAPARTSDGYSPYAMGFVVDSTAAGRFVWHNGFAPGAGGYCYNAIFPDDALAVAVLSNGALKRAQGKPERLVRQISSALRSVADP